MSGTVRAHRPVAQAPQPDAWNLYADRGDASDITEVSRERRPQPTRPSPMRVLRPLGNPPLSLWEMALVWLMVLIVMVIGWTVYGTYEVLR